MLKLSVRIPSPPRISGPGCPVAPSRSVAGLVALLAILLIVGSANAVPAGRAWIPVQALQAPDFDILVGPRLDLDPAGLPKLFVGAVVIGPAPNEGLGFDWADSAWAESWRLNFDPQWFWPVDAPPGKYHFVFVGGGSSESRKLFWAEARENLSSPPESIATTLRRSETYYGGAARGSRRWAGIDDHRVDNTGFLRLFISDEPGVWNELPITEPAANGISMMALDDSTALVAYNSLNRLRWGLIEGNTWSTNEEVLDTGYPGEPRLRPHPSGGAWLTWGTAEDVGAIRRFENGVWAPPESLFCNYSTDPFGVVIDRSELSRDAAPRPVVAWSYSSFLDGSSGVCVCMPDEDGWGVGDEVFRGGISAIPSVTRDRNGDAWVVWGELYEPLRWTHTYTSATAFAPVVTIDTGRPVLSWKLSEPAPDSWWAVLRQSTGGAFEEVARLQAGAEPQMSWTDLDSRPGMLRRDGVSYRIRRESVDKRYESLSPIGSWLPGSRRLHLVVREAATSGGALTVDLSGVSGSTVEITIYDVAGRAVRRHELETRGGDGTYRMPVSLGLNRLPAGMYFARARDDSGALSQGVKFVQLR